ncbi:hypothetical protein DRP43_02195 [candidate division TA06 bacterium]|uniref:Uncharacterized protein n=1 Tax=candidate division TA06 bacterium TaxID=2250710 RepID=A0A660SLV9_UNCT6|nr:MAG: hypothetical protein DRP43_02195 [candidate division TA06 bacterium]
MIWSSHLPFNLSSSGGAIGVGKNSGCPFCPLIIKTKVWSHDPVTDIFVVTDLNSRGYKYRLLAVGSGSYWHRPWEQYRKEEKQAIIDTLMQVVHQHEEEKRGRLINLDTIHFSYPAHGHIQANMGEWCE